MFPYLYAKMSWVVGHWYMLCKFCITKEEKLSCTLLYVTGLGDCFTF